MYLTSGQRRELECAAERGINAIDAVVQRLKDVNPEAFHTDASLKTRVFLLEPTQEVPCRAVRMHRKDGTTPGAFKLKQAPRPKSASDAG
ncbi:hypothetical protein [Paraburkholderia heleia]|uniref:hypothetical protein n=1 Tax=Paraburkholderia heleia TaxID=634127 RepID=UPI002AB73EE5|nr:hypothetical protein [Paraburkholderia heleia]